ncbi:type II toxin-antitoxin system RelE/ParE family toxin [Massilia terrae]|uniref:Type II toxin-antitoxin system RelE/ParE family toxin n=1 Tax=Massilia terrae TaxID=1811224 RepID=A0ABT2CZG6_9BURK|nr:type II toxin-antitoxin system RelE/ParE family toxin [Massilia terrae]MCS0659352.1 type II toxin-antitoxin system RelE/ParE family toxin [Massilia terrae]
MIKSFAHKGLERFYSTGTKAGIDPGHVAKLGRQLERLNEARSADDMDVPGWRLHSLSGKLRGHWAVKISGNWRLTFRFDGQDAWMVDYQDYH